jgi:AraC-like DNA-binding protein
MISTFNLIKLRDLLKDFYNLTKIRITVFSDRFEELIAYPEDISSLCHLLRIDPAAKQQCKRCDKEACSIASNRRSTYIYQCHAGLTEAISPIYFGNVLIGYLFFGQVFSFPTHEEGWWQISKRCEVYQVDPSLLKAACFERPIIPDDYILSASHILRAVASYLCLERMVIIKQQDLPIQIDQYILEHLTEHIDAKNICEHFQIGKTYLYEIAKQNYSMGIAEYIRTLRIEKAKTLLIEEPQKSISEIAAASGFPDYNYFITVFKRVTGTPPKQYRELETSKFSS